MMKYVKNVVSIGSLVGITYLFLSGSVFANIRVFNNSFSNQAGISQDIYLDTWDYMANPAFFGRLRNSALSLGVTNEGQLTGKANTAMFGIRGNIGLPLYVVAATYNGSTLLKDNTGSYSITAGTKTETATAITRQQDYRHRVGLGTDLGGLGLQLFADLNSTQGSNFKNSTYEYNNAAATGTTLKSESWNTRTQESPNRFGVNVGSETSGGMIWQVGLALQQRGGTEYAAQSADGTQKATIKNGNANNGAFAAVTGLSGLASAVGTDSTYAAPTFASSGIGAASNSKSGVTEALGHEFSALMYMPMSLVNPNDRLGLFLSHSGSTTFSQGDFSATFVNAGASTDMTMKVKHTSNGLGLINGGLNYATTFTPEGDTIGFTLIPTLSYKLDDGGTTYTPEITGKCGGNTITNTYGGFGAGGAACNATVLSYGTGGGATDYKSIQVYDTVNELAISMPVIFRYKVTSVLTMFAGTNPVITMSNTKKVVTKKTPAATEDVTETITNTGNNFTTTVAYAVGAQVKPVENFRMNLFATQSGGSSNLTTVAISADYLFGTVSNERSASKVASDAVKPISMPEVAPKSVEAPTVNVPAVPKKGFKKGR